MQIKTKVTRQIKLGAPRFTRAEMREIGDSVRDEEVKRIGQALKADLTPAAPLAVHQYIRKDGTPGRRRGYAIDKQRKKGTNKRDWKWSGDMLDSLKTTVSDPTRAVIKFASGQAKKAVIRDAKDDMFGLSKRGEVSGGTIAKRYLPRALKRANPK